MLHIYIYICMYLLTLYIYIYIFFFIYLCLYGLENDPVQAQRLKNRCFGLCKGFFPASSKGPLIKKSTPTHKREAGSTKK